MASRFIQALCSSTALITATRIFSVITILHLFKLLHLHHPVSAGNFHIIRRKHLTDTRRTACVPVPEFRPALSSRHQTSIHLGQLATAAPQVLHAPIQPCYPRSRLPPRIRALTATCHSLHKWLRSHLEASRRIRCASHRPTRIGLCTTYRINHVPTTGTAPSELQNARHTIFRLRVRGTDPPEDLRANLPSEFSMCFPDPDPQTLIMSQNQRECEPLHFSAASSEFSLLPPWPF